MGLAARYGTLHLKGGDEMNEPILFREVQRPRQIWIWVIILFIAAINWYGFIQQILFGIPFGNKPAPDFLLIIFWLVFGILFPLCLCFFMKLITEVRQDGVYIRFMPFHSKYQRIPFTDIEKYTAITFKPIAQFGGIGIRVNLQGETAYIMSGNEGIKVHQTNQKVIVIGSQRPNELIEALHAGKRMKQ